VRKNFKQLQKKIATNKKTSTNNERGLQIHLILAFFAPDFYSESILCVELFNFCGNCVYVWILGELDRISQ
jgi:hypothetical protein